MEDNMPKFILNIDAKNTKAEYNAYLIFSSDMLYMVDENIRPLLEIEFLTAKVEFDSAGYTRYDFKVTEQKQKELLGVIQRVQNRSIIEDNTCSLN
jgi:hypothetical protein